MRAEEPRGAGFPRIGRESDDAGGRRRVPGRGGCRAVEWDGVDVDVDVEWVG